MIAWPHTTTYFNILVVYLYQCKNERVYLLLEPDSRCSHCYDYSEQTPSGCRLAHPTGDNTCVNLQGNLPCSTDNPDIRAGKRDSARKCSAP